LFSLSFSPNPVFLSPSSLFSFFPLLVEIDVRGKEGKKKEREREGKEEEDYEVVVLSCSATIAFT
jgi:hypothetical protein